jgi:hypothetical protein
LALFPFLWGFGSWRRHDWQLHEPSVGPRERLRSLGPIPNTQSNRNVTSRTRRIRTGHRPARRGAVTLELIIMLPVWLIAMGAIVQFGLLIGLRQQVALASRVGAEEASRTASLSLTDNDPVPDNVVDVVEQQLLSSGIKQCAIMLEHNLDDAAITLRSGTPDCPTIGTSDDWPPPGNYYYVRVTVCVPATELTPNLLKFFGFDISQHVIRNATTFRHEL